MNDEPFYLRKEFHVILMIIFGIILIFYGLFGILDYSLNSQVDTLIIGLIFTIIGVVSLILAYLAAKGKISLNKSIFKQSKD